MGSLDMSSSVGSLVACSSVGGACSALPLLRSPVDPRATLLLLGALLVSNRWQWDPGGTSMRVANCTRRSPAPRQRRSSICSKSAKDGRRNSLAPPAPLSLPSPWSGTVHRYSTVRHLPHIQQHPGIQLHGASCLAPARWSRDVDSTAAASVFVAAIWPLPAGCWASGPGTAARGCAGATLQAASPSMCNAREMTSSSASSSMSWSVTPSVSSRSFGESLNSCVDLEPPLLTAVAVLAPCWAIHCLIPASTFEAFTKGAPPRTWTASSEHDHLSAAHRSRKQSWYSGLSAMSRWANRMWRPAESSRAESELGAASSRLPRSPSQSSPRFLPSPAARTSVDSAGMPQQLIWSSSSAAEARAWERHWTAVAESWCPDRSSRRVALQRRTSCANTGSATGIGVTRPAGTWPAGGCHGHGVELSSSSGSSRPSRMALHLA
mmetsp:Transcript_9564/g.25417  ORF Transcript_9564/g.25417 Transcript_9564/m.25417 type:complete len:436 (+) Transcript_9564:461-1768(+)